MTSVLAIAAFIALVVVYHYIRTAMSDVAGKAIEGAVNAARGDRPTRWTIEPDRLPADELHRALVGSLGPTELQGTTLQVVPEASGSVVRCVTPAEANLESVRPTVLRRARAADSGCRLRL